MSQGEEAFPGLDLEGTPERRPPDQPDGEAGAKAKGVEAAQQTGWSNDPPHLSTVTGVEIGKPPHR